MRGNNAWYKQRAGRREEIHEGFVNKLHSTEHLEHRTVTDEYTVFARVIWAFFFSILAAEKSGCVKYVDFFFVEVLIWVLF